MESSLVRFRPTRVLKDAGTLLAGPRTFFARIDRDANTGAAALTAVCWTGAAAMIHSFFGFATGGSATAGGEFLVYAMAAPVAFGIEFAILHGLCRFSGGRGTLRDTFLLCCALSVFAPAMAVCSFLGPLGLPVLLYRAYAAFAGVREFHELPITKSALSVAAGTVVLGAVFLGLPLAIVFLSPFIVFG